MIGQPPTSTLFPSTPLFRSHRAASTARGALRVSARGRSSARYFPTRSRTRREETPSTNRLGRAVLLTHVVFSEDRKSTRLNSSHGYISYAVFCLLEKFADYL